MNRLRRSTGEWRSPTTLTIQDEIERSPFPPTCYFLIRKLRISSLDQSFISRYPTRYSRTAEHYAQGAQQCRPTHSRRISRARWHWSSHSGNRWKDWEGGFMADVTKETEVM